MTNPITVGGEYVEDENHVPNPTDIVKQFNTEGVGAHGKIEEVSPVFEVDKVKTAEEIVGALDPKNTNVSADRVLLPNPVDDNDVAKEMLVEAAEARIEQGVVVGGPTPAEREAALDGEEGEDAAIEQDRQNAASNSTGNRDAGAHADASGAPVAGGSTPASGTTPSGEAVSPTSTTASQSTDGGTETAEQKAERERAEASGNSSDEKPGTSGSAEDKAKEQAQADKAREAKTPTGTSAAQTGTTPKK